jgi:hypothetical protein
MVGVGGFFIMGGGLIPHTFPQVLGALSVLLAFVNVSGGFVITKRMLDMFKRELHTPHLRPFTLTLCQVPPIPLSIPGYTRFQVSSSQVGILPQRVLEWLVLFKLDTSRAHYYASARYLASRHKQLLDRVTSSVYWESALESSHLWLQLGSRPRS